MIFLFGDFELDAARVELRRAGAVVPVQPKVLRLLLHLVQQRERVVPNEELLATLWPSEVVESGSIKRAVKSARAALGESANEGSSIRTVRGHGYQFVAALRSDGAVASKPSARARAIVVERAALSQSLAECWLEAEAERGQALLLSGEAGVGKSWALQWLGAHAEERGAIVWFGRAADVEGAPAYWPFITMLRDALRQPGELPWLELMGESATDLAQALPELRAALRVEHEAPAIEATAARFRFFDGMLGLLRRAAEHAPLLIMVDDLPLADAPTLQLFTFLARHVAGSRILLAASVRLLARAAEDDARSDDIAAIARFARTLHITGMTPDEVAEFVAALTSGAAEPSLIARLTQLTGGNPLLLTHTIYVCRPAHADAAPRWDALDVLTQSHGVRSAIGRHVAELRPPALACLQAAALLGQTFSRQLLADVLERDEVTVDAWLREAARIGLLTPLDDASGQASFTHGLVREVLAHNQDRVERQARHARAGAALAALHARAGAEPSAVAHHFLVAGHYERALEYSLLAARAALQQLAGSAAVQHYTRALQALDHMPADLPLRAALTFDKAAAQAQAGALEARATFIQAANLARELGDAVMLAKAALGIADPLEDVIDEELLGLLREALRSLDERDDHWPLMAAALAKVLSHGRDRDASQRAITTALGAAERLHDAGLRAQALAMCHEAMTEPEQLPLREPISAELAAIARSSSDASLLSRAARMQIQDALEVGDMQKVEVAVTLLEQLAERARDPFARWHSKTYRSMCAMVGGELERAIELAEEGLRLGSMVSPSTARHGYLVQLSGILRLRGEAERARTLVYEGTASYPRLTGWRCAVGVSEFEVGRASAAREIFAALMAEGIPSLARDAFVLSALCPLADLCAWVGDAAAARQLYEALLPYAAYCGTIGFGVMTYGPITRYLGALAAQSQNFEQAVKHFEQADRASSRMRSPTFVCLTAITHARALLDPACPARLQGRGLERLSFARKLARARGFGAVETYGELLDTFARQMQPTSPAIKGNA